MSSSSSSSHSGWAVVRTDGAQIPEYKLENPVRRILRTRELQSRDVTRLVLFNIGDDTAEFARKLLKGCLPSNVYKSILKVQKVSHTSGAPRLDLWVRAEVGEGLKRCVLAAFQNDRTPTAREALKRYLNYWESRRKLPWWWRMDVYRPWRDRIILKARAEKEAREPTSNVMTWNVNGYHSKSIMIEEALNNMRVAVCAIQETLVRPQSAPIRPKGYTVYSAPWLEGFRGQAVLVDERLPSYRIPHEEPWLIHVKISHWPYSDTENRILHVLGIYLPSGGNYKGNRGRKLRTLTNITNEIINKSSKELVMVLGDWNMSFRDLQRRLVYYHSEITALEVVGSGLSRFPTKGQAKDLDHIVGNPVVQSCFRRPRVLRSYAVSDHRPVLLGSRKLTGDAAQQEKRAGFDKNMITRHKQKLVSSNRWEAISKRVDMLYETENEAYLHTATDAFNITFDKICREYGIKYDVVDSKPNAHLPRHLRKKLNLLKAYSDKYAESVLRRNADEDRMRVNLARTKRAFKRAYDKWKDQQNVKSYSRIAKAMTEFDVKHAWQEIRRKSNLLNTTGEGEPMKPSQPLRNKNGALKTDSAGIQETLASHYKDLLQDVPNDDFKDPNWW
ncbi:hypothetical protein DAEQUDRAFT_680873, partial [Daedalea quercina L-15889]